MSELLSSATAGLLSGDPEQGIRAPFPVRLAEARKALPGELGPAIDLLDDESVGKSERETFDLVRLASLTADACLTHHNPRQAHREGAAPSQQELERWRAATLRLVRAVLHRRIKGNISFHRKDDGVLDELRSVMLWSLVHEAPPELNGPAKLARLLEAAGLGDLEIVAAYETGGTITTHALTRDTTRTLCGRPPARPTWGWVPRRLHPGQVSCGSCSSRLERAAREPLELGVFTELLDAACESKAICALRQAPLEELGRGWPHLESLGHTLYMREAAQRLLQVCHEDVEGLISRALTGKRLYEHPRLSSPTQRFELDEICANALLLEPREALAKMREETARFLNAG